MSAEAGNMQVGNHPNWQPVIGPTLENFRDSVFSNELFWRLLGKHLNFGDLAVCRLVSQNFNRKVLDETNFKRRGVIQLNEDRLHPDIFGSTMEMWKNVRIQAFALSPQSESKIDLNWLYSHFSDVEELYVSVDEMFFQSVNQYPALHQVLEATTCLKKLSIDQEFLSQSDVNIHLPVSKKKAVDDTLSNLTEVELMASGGRGRRSFVDNFENWMDNLANALKNLKVLGMNRGVPEKLYFQRADELLTKVQNLLGIVESNYCHLTSLRLDDMQLWGVLSMSKKTIPHLNSVKIRINQIEWGNTINFLRQQPVLRDIDVTVLDEFPVELLVVILEKKELSRLCIKTKRFAEFPSVLWKGLSELNNLEVFALHLVHTNNRVAFNPGLLQSCIVYLPPSVSKIHLKRIRAYPSGHAIDIAVTPDIFSNINPALLTELCISKYGYWMNDDVLEFVFRNFRFLRVLNISDNFLNCTDYGFTGRPMKSNSTPFSISNLRGLRHLTLRNCGAITDETLIHGIVFTELRYLDISNNTKITPKGCRAVLSQNPSLEVLKASMMAFESEDEMKKLYPRLKDHKLSDPGDSGDEDDEDSNRDYYESDDSNSDFN